MAATTEAPDKELADIAEYVAGPDITSDLAFEMAHLALLDFLGCALLALDEESCRRIIKPIVPGAVLPGGARVPGTDYEYDPAQAAFATGTMGRWLDFNDSWFGQGGGHPSDMWGAILGMGDYLSRNGTPVSMAKLLELGIKGYEIMCLHLADNRFGPYDYTSPLKAAVAAVITKLLGGGETEIVNAVSQGWADGQPLRLYRHGHTTARKNWASPDAAARGIWHAMKAVEGEPGFPNVLTTKTLGIYEAEQDGVGFVYPRPYGSFAMENILFKVYPAQFRGQTATEAAFRLYPEYKDRLDDIERVDVFTCDRAMRTVDKRGPLHSAADRDHCLQYIVTVGMIHGRLEYAFYHDETAADPRVEALRGKINLMEREAYTKGFEDPDVRTDATAIQVFFKDGTATEEVEVLYPLGDPSRRAESRPVLAEKFAHNIKGRVPAAGEKTLLDLYGAPERLRAMQADEFMALLAGGA
jgi:2-methylcitrate dehydratase